MKLVVFILCINLCSINKLCSQSNFGFEFTVSSFKTINDGKIEKIGTFFPYLITHEDDTWTESYSFGMYYKFTDIHLFKLNIGRHKNGRIFDWIKWDDMGSYRDGKGYNLPTYYLQIRPSYVLNLSIRKTSFPIEVGININKRIKQGDLFLPVNKYNFDLAMRIGVLYNFWNKISIGIHSAYLRNLGEYQDSNTVTGVFDPKQLGFEFSISYQLETKTVTNIR